jgi:hypothetical protein
MLGEGTASLDEVLKGVLGQ